MRILMVAAENGVLPGGKVGGMADVLAELPPALTALGHQLDVVIPAYGVYHKRDDAVLESRVDVPFGASTQLCELYRLTDFCGGVHQWVLHHPLFADPPGRIYHHDAAHQPFATDANLYALFARAIAACIESGSWPGLDVVHLHDWHTAGVLLFLPAASPLRKVFTIHNLALQGQRPLQGHASSFAAWFGGTRCPADAIDPRFPDCYNPMRLGITHADQVHAVSPGYASEIVHASNSGSRGGEGLEADLRRAAEEGRLHGILNGCEYPRDRPRKVSRTDLWELIERTLARWLATSDTLSPAYFLASRNLGRIRKLKRKPMLVTSVGRLVPQKIDLLRATPEPGGASTLEKMLRDSGNGVALVVLGTGDPDCERFLIELAAVYPQLLYLRGYDDDVASALYDNGDLFLMPSAFEPCGISQMLAMRAGQPCLVHATGGLRDTVSDDIDGFCFEATSTETAPLALARRWTEVLQLFQADTQTWKRIQSAAVTRRFDWAASATEYLAQLYSDHP
jgi:starch synthase